MMQPPVGVQPRDAFRDAQFCCFLSIKLKSDVHVSSVDLWNLSADADKPRSLDFKGADRRSQLSTEKLVYFMLLLTILKSMLHIPFYFFNFRTMCCICKLTITKTL